MPRFGTRGRRTWAIVSALALALATAAGTPWWARSRPSDPLGSAIAAYAGGDWSMAAGLARERLKSAADDSAALRLLARASVRSGRDSAAQSINERLEARLMTAED